MFLRCLFVSAILAVLVKDGMSDPSYCCASTSYASDWTWCASSSSPGSFAGCSTCVSYQCIDWTVGSAGMQSRGTSFKSRTGQNVWFGVGSYGNNPAVAGNCYRIKSNGATKDLLVQVVNSGGDVPAGNFDIQTGDGGFGIYDACTNAGTTMPQFSGTSSQWGNQYGGWYSQADCAQLPAYPACGSNPADSMRDLCTWSFSNIARGASTGNPVITSMCQVACPSELYTATGLWRSDEPTTSYTCDGSTPVVSSGGTLTTMMDCSKPSYGWSNNVQGSTHKGYEQVIPCRADGYTRINYVPGTPVTPPATFPPSARPVANPNPSPSAKPVAAPISLPSAKPVAAPVTTPKPSSSPVSTPSSSSNACLAGYYCSGGAGTCAYTYQCVGCVAGTYSAAGAYSCTSCPSGSVSTSSYASTSCTKCTAGTYSAQNYCTGCQGGYYSNVGAGVCTACPAGTISSYGSPQCSACPAGTYSATGGQYCQACPSGSTSSAGSASCSGGNGGAAPQAAVVSCTQTCDGFTAADWSAVSVNATHTFGDALSALLSAQSGLLITADDITVSAVSDYSATANGDGEAKLQLIISTSASAMDASSVEEATSKLIAALEKIQIGSFSSLLQSKSRLTDFTADLFQKATCSGLTASVLGGSSGSSGGSASQLSTAQLAGLIVGVVLAVAALLAGLAFYFRSPASASTIDGTSAEGKNSVELKDVASSTATNPMRAAEASSV